MWCSSVARDERSAHRIWWPKACEPLAEESEPSKEVLAQALRGKGVQEEAILAGANSCMRAAENYEQHKVVTASLESLRGCQSVVIARGRSLRATRRNECVSRALKEKETKVRGIS